MRSKVKTNLFTLCLIAASYTLSAAASQTPKKLCTREEAIQAEEEASEPANWGSLQESFRKFAQCDDGAIAEGYSDSVARLLSDSWDTLDQLRRLGEQDETFREFVLHHVDDMMSPTQEQKISKNVNNRCPKGSKQLCDEILRRINQVGGPAKKK
jgi:hypothetical protein